MIKIFKSGLPFDKRCRYHQYQDIEGNVLMIENLIKIKSNSILYENMTKETLETAAKMYFYLNSCSDEIKSWLIFYNDLFKNHQADQIVLSLNRILWSDHTLKNKKYKSIAEKLFNKTTDLFKLKHQIIKNITDGIGNVSSSKEYTSIRGNCKTKVYNIYSLSLWCRYGKCKSSCSHSHKGK